MRDFLYYGKPIDEYTREQLIQIIGEQYVSILSLQQKAYDLKIDGIGKIPRYSRISFWEWVSAWLIPRRVFGKKSMRFDGVGEYIDTPDTDDFHKLLFAVGKAKSEKTERDILET